MITDSQAVSYGILAIYAEDTFSKSKGNLVPIADPGIACAGWEIVANVMARDALIPKIGDKNRSLTNSDSNVYYGYVAYKKENPNSWVVVIRGTQRVVEWVIDAEFTPKDHPTCADAKVERGFWGIYSTMELTDIATGRMINSNTVDGIANFVDKGTVTIIGHSLGSALATYLSFDLARKLDDRVSACLFASPRTGDNAWVNNYEKMVKNYNLYNYLIDVVTHVPPRPLYAPLVKERRIEPNTAQAGIRLDLGCNHHVICYCAMLDYALTKKYIGMRNSCENDCILGDKSKVTDGSRLLANAVKMCSADDAIMDELNAIFHTHASPTRM